MRIGRLRLLWQPVTPVHGAGRLTGRVRPGVRLHPNMQYERRFVLPQPQPETGQRNASSLHETQRQHLGRRSR